MDPEETLRVVLLECQRVSSMVECRRTWQMSGEGWREREEESAFVVNRMETKALTLEDWEN